MRHSRLSAGFTIVDLLIVLVVVTLLASLALPTLARVSGDSMVQESMNNLVTLSVAHVLYAADWNGRQVTWAVDDLAAFGDDGPPPSRCGTLWKKKVPKSRKISGQTAYLLLAADRLSMRNPVPVPKTTKA